MKYYSEKLSKLFESQEELEKAEVEANEGAVKEEEKLAVTKKEKKELAKAVDDADEALTKAYTEYDLARDEAKKIMSEARDKCKELLAPKETAIKEAERVKWNAIVDFNNKYGRYTRVYTGDEAIREFKRASNIIDNMFKHFWF